MGPSSSRPTQPTSDGARLSRSGTPATTSAPSSAAMVAACLRQYERPIATTAWSGHQDVGQVLERLSTYSQRVASWRRHADAAQRSGAAGDAASVAGTRPRTPSQRWRYQPGGGSVRLSSLTKSSARATASQRRAKKSWQIIPASASAVTVTAHWLSALVTSTSCVLASLRRTIPLGAGRRVPSLRRGGAIAIAKPLLRGERVGRWADRPLPLAAHRLRKTPVGRLQLWRKPASGGRARGVRDPAAASPGRPAGSPRVAPAAAARPRPSPAPTRRAP